MNNSVISQELRAAIEVSRQAGTIAMQYFRDGVATENKQDGTPVTLADRECETIIQETLRMQFPKYGFLGEESGETKSNDGRLWVVDPIDGTKNFIRHIPLFGILIGLMEDGVCTLGVSNVPGMEELQWGQLGIGAFMNDQPIQVSNTALLSESMISLGGIKKLVGLRDGKTFAALTDRVSRFRSFGDAYAYHLVASGRFEAVIEAGIKIWDIAAAVAIIESAGGKCTDFDGNPVTIETTNIVASNGKVHEEILHILNQ